jgi:hypothetical protein
MSELHLNWFLFSIIFWSTLNYLDNFKKNRIPGFINNLITVLFLGLSYYNNYPDFFCKTIDDNKTLDIFSVFIVYINIGYMLLEIILNPETYLNITIMILLSGYVYGGFFSGLITVFFLFQFLEIIDTIIFFFKIKNIEFNKYTRLMLVFYLYFCFFVDCINYHNIDNLISYYWYLIGSISIYVIIIYNFYIIF